MGVLELGFFALTKKKTSKESNLAFLLKLFTIVLSVLVVCVIVVVVVCVKEICTFFPFPRTVCV